MTRTHRTTLCAATLLVAAMLPAPALADASIPERVATGVGRIIAEQGNAALRQIRAEVRKEWLDSVERYLPERASTPDHSGPEADRSPAAR